MSTDVQLHALVEPCTEGDLAKFFDHTLGSPWCNLWAPMTQRTDEEERAIYSRVADCPSFFLGEASWGDADPHVTDVAELIGYRFPVVDDHLIEVLGKLWPENDRRDQLLAFLEANRGHKLFRVYW
jgi:hypothetical protein